jgi:hypothetical protein
MSFVHELPSWLFAIATIVGFVGGATTGLVFARRWGRRREIHALVDNGVVGWIFSGTIVIYAIAIGLITVETWGNASAASAAASKEAGCIAALYRDLGGYPQPLQRELQQELVGYTHYVIEEDWPAQRRGEVPRGGSRLLTRFRHAMFAFEPATDGQRALHAEALHSFNEILEARQARLDAVSLGVPASLWAVVLVGAVLSILASYVFSMESVGLHAFMTGLLAAMIALLVFFIATTDRPYQGRTGLAATDYKLVLHGEMERDAAP